MGFFSKKPEENQQAEQSLTAEAEEQSAQESVPETKEAEGQAVQEAVPETKETEEQAVQEAVPETPEPVGTEQPPKAKKIRRRYMYAACDRAGNVLRRKDGSLYVQTVIGEDLPGGQSWPEEIQLKVQVNQKFKAEIEGLGENPSRQDMDKAKKAARETLNRLAEEQEKSRKQASPPEQVQDESTSPEPEMEASPEAERPLDKPSEKPLPETAAPLETAPKADRQPEEPVRSKPPMPPLPEVPAPAPGVDAEAVLNALNRTGTMLNEDHTLIMDQVEEEHKKSKDYMEQKARCLEARVRESAEAVQRSAENAVKRMDHAARDLGEKQDKLLSRTNSMTKQVADLEESVQSMEGNLKKLAQLDKITELLQNKGMVITMDIPPVNADEEDIVNLVRYSQKITEQLGYAARELLRKQDMFKNQEQHNANEQKAMERKAAEMRAAGFREGRLEAVKRLLSKYEDINAVRMSDNDYVHAIWSFLEELGVEIDGEGRFEKGREIQFSEEDAQRMLEIYSKINGAGKYRVTRTGLVWDREIILKAEFERMPDQPEQAVDSQPGQAGPG